MQDYSTCQSGFTRKRYRCLCASVFTGHDCEKVCGENASCTNTEGSCNCSCNPGFNGDENPDLISDIDECSKNSHNCSYTTATCTNTRGSFKCICKPGFSGDGHNCTDINECANDTHNCSRDNATCSNTARSTVLAILDLLVMDTSAKT
ncbi:unnamed protein product [Pocillopora meandrina]|uniref:EGF-like domain-containing protein n=1 Tax=Pocillopora meandrina TaxID=46732 RepID=A0AAU9Y1A8_9CNID|nr:unnamed protein product [Pocillopora meandrina]